MLRDVIQYCRTHQIFRFYLILIPILWAILVLSFASWRIGVDFGDAFALSLWSCQAVVMVLMMVLSAVFLRRMIRENTGSVTAPHPDTDRLDHLVLLPCYNEPVTVIAATLDSLARQSDPQRIRVMVSFEEKSPDLDNSMRLLNAKYADSFGDFHITVHPAGLTGEIRGKCSNGRWAIQAALERARSLGHAFDPATTTLTSMDSDTIVHRRYFEVLADKFLHAGETDRLSTIWQGGLFYNYGLEGSYFFTRVTALLRTVWMIGFNIPLQVHPMSVFSTSLKLCQDNDFFDPTYQMDDMHFFAKSMATRRGKVRLQAIHLPLICGPTSGHDFRDELGEWALQARRWSIGAFEIFHYVFSQAPKLGVLVTARLLLTILALYGLFQSILFATTLIASPVWRTTLRENEIQHMLWYVVDVIPWLFIAWCFVIDAIFIRHFEVPDRPIGLGRNLLHVLSAPFVLFGYNLVSFVALHILAVRGKAVCAHDISAKNNLPQTDSAEAVFGAGLPETPATGR